MAAEEIGREISGNPILRKHVESNPWKIERVQRKSMLREDAPRGTGGIFCVARSSVREGVGGGVVVFAFSKRTLRYNLPANNGRSSSVTALNNDVIDSNAIHNARV